jgi:hypothetical protein
MDKPPTTGANVVKSGTNQWAATGKLFDALMNRCHALGTNGFRAVLWHQGESDAGQVRWGCPASVQITGDQYAAFMEALIRASREKAGWTIPWITAVTTIHSRTEEQDKEFSDAQRSLWGKKLAIEGPDTDTLRGNMRTDVHFSGAGLRAHGEAWAQKVGVWLDGILK